MIEVELKGVVDDLALRRAMVERAGGTLVFSGRLMDRRYDTAERALAARDHVLRLRSYVTPRESRTLMEWKGPTQLEDGFKLREEVGTAVDDGATLALMLERLGYLVTTAIDREIAQYELGGATIRFEQYPRLDVLVEVEGDPAAIELAIRTLGLPRESFSTDRLSHFTARYEERTGMRAAICDADLRALEADG